MNNNISNNSSEKNNEIEDASKKINIEDLRSLLFWEGRTIHDWNDNDTKLAHLIRNLHYHKQEDLTEEDQALLGRVLSERSTEDIASVREKISTLSPKHLG